MSEHATLVEQLRCKHEQRTGGNDYIYCPACHLTWDYRRETADDVVKREAAAALAAPPAPVDRDTIVGRLRRAESQQEIQEIANELYVTLAAPPAQDGDTREAFRAGFLATVPDETGKWGFGGPAAHDREAHAWASWVEQGRPKAEVDPEVLVAERRAAPAVGERSYYEQMKANAEAGLNRQTTDTPAVGEATPTAALAHVREGR